MGRRVGDWPWPSAQFWGKGEGEGRGRHTGAQAGEQCLPEQRQDDGSRLGGWGKGRQGPTAFLSPVFWNESSSPICLSFLSECLLSLGLLQRILSHVHLSSKQ